MSKSETKMPKSYKKSIKTDHDKKDHVLAPINTSNFTNWDGTPLKDCPICFKEFTSEHAYQIHVRKHRPECIHCDLQLKSWSEYSDHIPHCSRKRGAQFVPGIFRRSLGSLHKRPVFKFKCQLCRRRYANQKKLRNHQINRCERRYLRNGWVVKV